VIVADEGKRVESSGSTLDDKGTEGGPVTKPRSSRLKGETGIGVVVFRTEDTEEGIAPATVPLGEGRHGNQHLRGQIRKFGLPATRDEERRGPGPRKSVAMFRKEARRVCSCHRPEEDSFISNHREGPISRELSPTAAKKTSEGRELLYHTACYALAAERRKGKRPLSLGGARSITVEMVGGPRLSSSCGEKKGS